jgi:hypothetical protein
VSTAKIENMIDKLKELDNNTFSLIQEINNITKDINQRVDIIWRSLCDLSGRKINWYSFNNDSPPFDTGETTGGSFDIRIHKDFISLVGEFDKIGHGHLYDNGFPTEFLYESNEKWNKKVLDDLQRVKKEKEILNQIQNKLSAEEWEYLKDILK